MLRSFEFLIEGTRSRNVSTDCIKRGNDKKSNSNNFGSFRDSISLTSSVILYVTNMIDLLTQHLLWLDNSQLFKENENVGMKCSAGAKLVIPLTYL